MILDGLVPIYKSKYTRTHFDQFVSAFRKEYPFSKYTIDSCGIVRCLTDITIMGMREEETIGEFFYTSLGELYFYNKRGVLISRTISNGFFRVDKAHRLIIDFLLNFKFKRLVSLVTSRGNPCTDKTFVEAEELYKVYWVRHYDKS